MNVQIPSPEHKSSNGLPGLCVREIKRVIANRATDDYDRYLASINNRNSLRDVLGFSLQYVMGIRSREILSVSAKLLKLFIIKMSILILQKRG